MAKRKGQPPTNKELPIGRTEFTGHWHEITMEVLDPPEPIKPRRKAKPPRRRKPGK